MPVFGNAVYNSTQPWHLDSTAWPGIEQSEGRYMELGRRLQILTLQSTRWEVEVHEARPQPRG
jgi:hypothetical protein